MGRAYINVNEGPPKEVSLHSSFTMSLSLLSTQPDHPASAKFRVHARLLWEDCSAVDATLTLKTLLPPQYLELCMYESGDLPLMLGGSIKPFTTQRCRLQLELFVVVEDKCSDEAMHTCYSEPFVLLRNGTCHYCVVIIDF
jgi:hypothetical protein